MNSFELNKIAGAILASCLVVVAVSEISNIAISPTMPEKAAYPVAMEEAATETASTEAATEGPTLGALLASADIAKGKKVFKKCAACHTLDDGGANKIGPNLFGILNRPKGSTEGFAYSGPLMDMGGDWSYEALDAFLAKPKDYIKGTKMSFSGIKKPADRANLIAFLRTLGGEGIALPSAE